MSLPILILLMLACPALGWLAVVIFRFNRRRMHVIRCASQLRESELQGIYKLVEVIGGEPANGYVLARTNRTASDERMLIPLTGPSAPSPWLGRQVEVIIGKEVTFSLSEPTVSEPQLLGKVFATVAVPRHKAKANGKARNTYDPNRYVAESEELRKALIAACPENPVGLLAYLLCAGRDSFEFEPSDQVRIGTSPSWVQDPEHQRCPQCNKRMMLIVQVPGTVISRKAFHRGTFFLFGCASHPVETKSLVQFT